jgi:putative ABC transport system permease protein
MLLQGVQRALVAPGAADVAVVLAQGAGSELESSIDSEVAALVRAQPGVRADGKGAPLAIAELVLVSALPRRDAEGLTNVALRGVTEGSWGFRPRLKVVEGRAPKAGSREAALGRKLVGRLQGLELNRPFELRPGQALDVVGVFEDGGSLNESEVWADIDVLRVAFGREGIASSVRARLDSPAALDPFRAAVEHDKRLGLTAWREPDFLEALSAGVTPLVLGVGLFVSLFFGLAATLGAMVTMHGAVAARSREIGVLRALGFTRGHVLAAFLFETMALTLAGGALGTAAAMLLTFVKFSLLSTNWSEVVFSFEPTPSVLVTAALAAMAMGLLGGLLPALRASRVSPALTMKAR